MCTRLRAILSVGANVLGIVLFGVWVLGRRVLSDSNAFHFPWLIITACNLFFHDFINQDSVSLSAFLFRISG